MSLVEYFAVGLVFTILSVIAIAIVIGTTRPLWQKLGKVYRREGGRVVALKALKASAIIVVVFAFIMTVGYFSVEFLGAGINPPNN